jgi:hypothetical protein
MNFSLLIAALLAATAAGDVRQREDPCERGDYTACYRADEQPFLDAFGLSSATAHLAAGEEVRRAMYFGRSLNAIVAVEYRRAAGQEPSVALYLPRRDEVAMPAPAVSVPVPLEDWERIGEASRFFDRSLVPLPAEPAGEILSVCADGATYIVETTGPRGRPPLRQRVENTCEDGLATIYAELMADEAFRLIPACRTLQAPDGLWRLHACAMLQGDRMAAALAHNRLDRLRFADRREDIGSLFDRAAKLDWNGVHTSGNAEAADAWIAGTRGADRASFFLRRLTGESSQRVRVEAVLERWGEASGEGDDAPPPLFQAPVELVLQWRPDRQFHIVEARVGAFGRVAARCYPGRLTGAGGC